MNVRSLKSIMRNPINLKLNCHVRRSLAILNFVALLNLSLPLLPDALAAPCREASKATGVIHVAGTVTIDGVRGTSGQTIFPVSQITTSEGSESIIRLGKFTRLRLLPETDFTLDFSGERIASTLSKGGVRGFIPAGIPFSIKTAEGELRTDPSQPCEFTVQVDDENTNVSVKTGRVELQRENNLETVNAGEVFSTDAGSQTTPDEENGLTDRQKVGIFAAIGAAAALLIIVLRGGEEEEEQQFGGCPVIPSGTTGQTGICP